MCFHRARLLARCAGLPLLTALFPLLAGCGPIDEEIEPRQVPDGFCAETTTGCFRNIDCGAGSLCTKPEDASGVEDPGCCMRVLCLDNDDCQAGDICHVRTGTCIPAGTCDPEVPCDGDGLCHYVSGQPVCLPAEDVPPAASCEMDPLRVTIGSGESAAVRVLPLRLDGGLTDRPVSLSASTESAAQVELSGLSLTATCEGPDPCRETLVATVDDASCSGELLVLPSLPSETVRVVVVDDRTGAGLAGTGVAVAIQGGEILELETDELGIATATSDGQAVAAVTAWAADRRTLTVVGNYRDAVLSLRTLPAADVIRGLRGQFSWEEQRRVGDIRFGYVGLSSTTQLHDYGFIDFLGPPVRYEVDLEGVTEGPVNLPAASGFVMELGSAEMKPVGTALTDDPSPLLWATSTKFRLAEAGPILARAAGAEDDEQSVRAAMELARAFDPANHLLQHAPVLNEGAAPSPPIQDESDWDLPLSPDRLDPAVFSHLEVTGAFPTLPCGADEITASGACVRSGQTLGAHVLVLADVPARGLVPLGTTAVFDAEDGTAANNGLIDVPGLAPGVFSVGHAPAHSGLTLGSPVLMAIVLDRDALDTYRVTARAVHRADTFAELQGFDAVFDDPPAAIIDSALTVVDIDVAPGATAYRLRIGAGAWDVWIPAADASGPVPLSALVPSAASLNAVDVELEVLRFTTGTSIDDLVAPSGVNLDAVERVLSSSTSVSCQPGSLGRCRID